MILILSKFPATYLKLLTFILALKCILVTSVLQSNDIRNYMGTRTPYRFKCNKDDSRISFPSCKELKIWMILRHGTRFPSAKDILGMNTTLINIKYEILLQNKHNRAVLKKEQLNNLESWTNNLTTDMEKNLAFEGQEEMILLAERMQKRFPSIIHETYKNKTFQFRYTATQRAQQSAKYFTLGLFEKKDAQEVVFEPALKVDTTLRFYKHCDMWQKQVKKNPETYKELNLFATSQKMNETLEAISKRLGLNRVLSFDAVVLMYRICGYETSWHKHSTSPWCYGFDLPSVKVLEYYYDLKHYWLDGYGHNVAHPPACMLYKDMFKTFSNDGVKATFLFAHSGTLLKLLAHLQLYKPEEHLRGDAVDDKRDWIASNIDCFASNIAFVLYKCEDGDRILTMHQERVVKLPMCDEDLCPVEHLKQYFHDSIFNCNYTDICSLHKNQS